MRQSAKGRVLCDVFKGSEWMYSNPVSGAESSTTAAVGAESITSARAAADEEEEGRCDRVDMLRGRRLCPHRLLHLATLMCSSGRVSLGPPGRRPLGLASADGGETVPLTGPWRYRCHCLKCEPLLGRSSW